MATFLFEIGSEEIPSRFMAAYEHDVQAAFEKALSEAGYTGYSTQIFSTPRRLAILIENLLEIQPLQEEEVLGPAVRIAFDDKGEPSKAAMGFAKSLGLDIADLGRKETEKGEYLFGMKKTGGQSTKALLEGLCPSVLSHLSFPKRMRWGSGTFNYARPLRWLCALLDADIVNFSLGGLDSGNQSYGHRVHGAGPFTIPHAKDYVATVEKLGGLCASAAKRRQHIIEEGNKAALALKAEIIWDESLLDEVQGLVEHPVPLIGDIDPAFLELPREVLLTSMQSHQKSFGLADANGALVPHFLTVSNLASTDMAVVKNGWERVLRARLEDARFFWKSDLSSSFDTWLSALENVIFLAPLGSMADKTRRIAKLCAWLVDNIDEQGKSSAFQELSAELAERAGRLSKADLVSSMVGEFDSLQGFMAGMYAEKFGEDAQVAKALAEQYLPAGPDSPVPSTPLGSVLSIADKIDTLVGCFGLAMLPTGAADPYALRRACLGIARIMLENAYTFDMKALCAFAFTAYGERPWKLPLDEATEKLMAFYALRVKNFFVSQKDETQAENDPRLVEAVCAPSPLQPYTISTRLKALTALSKQDDFVALVQACKRMVNIVHKFDADNPAEQSLTWDSALLQDEAEKALATHLTEMLPLFDKALAESNLSQCFTYVNDLRPIIEAFFDEVMVMCEDMKLRKNRVALLRAIVARLDTIFDPSALQI